MLKPRYNWRSPDGHLFAIHHAHSHDSSISGIPLPVGQEQHQVAIMPSADAGREKQAQDLADRLAYLRTVHTLYSRVPFLLDPAKSLSLQSLFQPLELLQNPLASEEVFQEDRHAWLGPVQPQNAQQGQPLQHQPPFYVRTVDNSEEALKKSPQGRMVIVANPGAGKTTLLRYMVAERARQAMEDPSMPVPIFISLPDLADMNMQVETYLASTQERMLQSPEYAGTLRNAITQGQAFVCLDGLDEVAAHKRVEMVRWINLWASRPGNTWIVSSRLADYKEGQFAEGQFIEWGLQPMDHQLRSHLAQQLLPQLQKHIRNAHSSIDPTAFVEALEKHPRAATWGENPLLFGLAALVFVRVGRLPSARSILYKEATNVIIEAHEPEVWKQVELRLAAAVLAKRLYSAQQYTFKARELFVVVQKMYKDQAITREPTEMTARILTSGILEEIRPQTYRFHHQTLLEYLTAVEIAQGLLSSDQGQREEMQRFVSGVSASDDWREVLRLMVGILVHRDEYEGEQHEREGAQAAIRWLSLVLQQREAQADQQDRGLMLALHSLSEVAHTESHYWMFYGGRDLEKKAALAWAGRMLKRWWADHSWDPLADEVRLLDATAVKVTCDTLLSEKERFIQAVDALGMIGNSGDGELLKRLRMVYEEHWVAYVKREGTDFVNRGMTALIVALALVRLGQHQYVQWLLEVTKVAPFLDMNGSIRTAIAQALGKSHAADAVQLLVKLLRDRNARIEHGLTRMGIAAAQALEQAVEYTPPEILLPVLLDALSDQTPEVHTTAAHVLGRLWRRISGRELASAIRSHFQEERKAAEQLLLASEGEIPVARVSAMLASSNPSVRVVGLHLLDRLQEPVMAIVWQALLQDKDSDVRKAAIERGTRQRGQVPIGRLIATLYDQDWEVRAAAVAALISRKEEIP